MKPETRTFYEAAVVRAVERVGRSLDEALDLHALAREAALSAFHFQRGFRGLVGETPLELHRRLRMERAAHRLCRTRGSVTAIAFDAGYDTHEAFTRAFGQRYGVSPSAFRDRGDDAASACHAGPLTELAARCGLHVRDGRVDLGALTLTTGGITMDVTIETLPARRLATSARTRRSPRRSTASARSPPSAVSTRTSTRRCSHSTTTTPKPRRPPSSAPTPRWWCATASHFPPVSPR